jgi:hypothetical protein
MENEKTIRLYEALDKLASSIPELKQIWNQHLLTEYENYPELHFRTPFEDMYEISGYIIAKEKEADIRHFEKFFDTLEQVFNEFDETTNSCIAVGIIEDGFLSNMQDYSQRFNEWLKPTTLKCWQNIVNDTSDQGLRKK